MPFIDIFEYGIVIRRQALVTNDMDIVTLSAVLEFDAPLEINDDLVSFGPCFGLEATDTFTRRLQALGLQYVDDFFVFSGDFPPWCRFKVALVTAPLPRWKPLKTDQDAQVAGSGQKIGSQTALSNTP